MIHTNANARSTFITGLSVTFADGLAFFKEPVVDIRQVAALFLLIIIKIHINKGNRSSSHSNCGYFKYK
jgi:hypothetical protein